MSEKINVGVYVAGKEVVVPAEVEYYSQQERVKKAAQALGVCWAVALLTVPVPILHLVITPLALFMGPLMAIFVYIKVKKLPKKLQGSVTCGNCQALTEFNFVETKPPLFDACKQCRTGYEVLWPPRG